MMFMNWTPCALSIEMYNAAVQNIMVVPQKSKTRITVLSSNSTSGYIPKVIEERILKRFVHPYS